MANDINDILGINLPKEEPASKSKIISDLLQNLVFSLGQGYSAQGGARGPQARSAGIGAALQGPMVLQQIRQQQANDQQDRAIKIAQLRQAALRGDQEAALKFRDAIGNPVAQTESVTTTGLPLPVTMDTEIKPPPVQFPLGGGRSMSMPITSAQDAIRASGIAEDQKQAILAKYRPAPAQRNIDPNSPQGIAARLEFERNKPQTGAGIEPDKVMVDGQATSVFRKGMDYFDANTKQPITGRITPYITPPSPRQKGEITPTAEAGLVTQLNKQWQTASKDVQSLYRANTIMDEGMKAARAGNMNAGSQAVLVTFQKFLDPTSVVRESEYARSGAGLAMAQRIRGWYEKNVETGGAGVPIDELQRFADLAKEINNRLASESTSLLAAEKKRIGAIADRYGIPQELVLTNYDFGGQGGGGQQAPKIGEVVNGYKFLGGNPADPKSWGKP